MTCPGLTTECILQQSRRDWLETQRFPLPAGVSVVGNTCVLPVEAATSSWAEASGRCENSHGKHRSRTNIGRTHQSMLNYVFAAMRPQMAGHCMGVSFRSAACCPCLESGNPFVMASRAAAF